MAYNPGESYFRQESRFSAKDAGGDQGDWSQYLQADGSKMQAAMSRLNDSKAPPKTFNEQEDQVLAQQAEAVPLQQWEQGMQRNMNQFQTVMQTGFTGLNATQQYQQAKELAALQKQGIQQGAMFGAIQSGLGAIGGFFSGGGGSGSSFTSPQIQAAGNQYGPKAFASNLGGHFTVGRTLF
jgi:hypothetical protein